MLQGRVSRQEQKTTSTLKTHFSWNKTLKSKQEIKGHQPRGCAIRNWRLPPETRATRSQIEALMEISKRVGSKRGRGRSGAARPPGRPRRRSSSRHRPVLPLERGGRATPLLCAAAHQQVSVHKGDGAGPETGTKPCSQPAASGWQPSSSRPARPPSSSQVVRCGLCQGHTSHPTATRTSLCCTPGRLAARRAKCTWFSNISPMHSRSSWTRCILSGILTVSLLFVLRQVF